jgi:uncharacterized protein (DUF58 family)
MVLPDPVVKMIKLFCWVLLIGVFFANTVVIMLSFIPFMVAAIGLLTKQPSKITIERSYSRERVFSGEAIEICLDIEAQEGMGIIEVCEILPRHFEVIEGSNYKIFWKGMGTVKYRLVYKLRCTTSGTYHIGNTAIKVYHCIYGHVHSSMERNPKIIEVNPRLFDTTKAKSISNFSKIPMPLGNISNMGMSTLEFKEIRQYSYGDSFKFINWKATARNLNKGGNLPIVNDYEKEGKKSVWIYLNVSKSMGMGSNIKNSLESGLEAVNSLVDFYLKQNAFVAFGTYNDMHEFIYPGSGQKHYIKILKTILRCSSNIGAARKSGNKPISLKEAVICNKKYMSGSEPLFIIVTRYYDKFYDSLIEGIDEMSKYASYRKGVFKIMIVNIIGYGMAANSDLEKLSAELQHLKDYKNIQRLRKKCIWIDWDPSQTSFSKALMSQVVGI